MHRIPEEGAHYEIKKSFKTPERSIIVFQNDRAFRKFFINTSTIISPRSGNKTMTTDILPSRVSEVQQFKPNLT